MERLGHRATLDGVRGLAIVLVVLFHLNTGLGICCLPQGGFVGVDVFFVLSGFLITTLLLERHATEPGLWQFYRRRFLRLLPALFFFLLVHAALFAVLQPSYLSDVIAGTAMALSYVMNWFESANMVAVTSLSHTWSLAVEEQFYVIWPLVLTVVLNRGANRRRIALWVGVVVVAIAVWRLALFLTLGESSWHALQYRTDTRADALLIGTWIALVRPSLSRLSASAASTVGSAALAAIILAAFALPVWHPVWYLGGLTGVAVLSGVVLIAALDPRWSLFPLLSTRPLAGLGKLSYSIYLWHAPVFLAVLEWGPRSAWQRVGLALSVTAVMSAISYVFVEIPFLRRKDHASTRRATPNTQTGSQPLEPAAASATS